MESFNPTSNLSKLIYKFPFSNPLFLTYDILLNWKLSNTILVTSYDLIKDEQLMIYLTRKGITLNEYLKEKGFNKDVKIVCDTGIFEYEAKKAKLKIDMPDLDTFLMEDIFHLILYKIAETLFSLGI